MHNAALCPTVEKRGRILITLHIVRRDGTAKKKWLTARGPNFYPGDYGGEHKKSLGGRWGKGMGKEAKTKTDERTFEEKGKARFGDA